MDFFSNLGCKIEPTPWHKFLVLAQKRFPSIWDPHFRPVCTRFPRTFFFLFRLDPCNWSTDSSVYCSAALSHSPSGIPHLFMCKRTSRMLTMTWFRSGQNWMPQQTNWRACNFRTHWKSSSAWLPAIWAVALACRSTRSNTSLYHHQTDSDYSSFAPRFDTWPEIANQSCNCKRRAFSRQSNQAKPFGHT